MKIPFTTEQFLEVFQHYNEAVWPLQILFYLLAFLATLLTFKKIGSADKIIAAILSFFWIWMGLVYHIIFFSTINPAAYFFGSTFILEGLLFLYFGFFRKTLCFYFHPDIYGITGGLFLFFALIIYPLLGFFKGHVYPASPTFGLPCPTSIFTFGLLLWLDKKIPFAVLIIPMAWAVIGFSAAFSLGMREDIGLIVAGVLFLVLQIFRNKRSSGQKAGPGMMSCP